MSKTQIALIGCGKFAHGHMRSIQEQGDRTEVIAVVDIDETRAREFAATYNIPHSYGGPEALFREQHPDLVIIVSPPGDHFHHCIEALEAGSHVLCEKPLAGSLAQLDQIEATIQRTGSTCTGVLQWRYGSSGQHVKRLLDEGALGKPLVGICQTTWYREPAYYEIPWRGKWATELGGVAMTLGIHAMDFFMWLMGDWDTISATVGTLDRDIEVENVALAHVHFSNGAMASLINSAVSPHQESYIRIDCQQATVELRHLYSYRDESWTFTLPPTELRTKALKQWETMPEEKPATIGTQLASLLDALDRSEAPWPRVDDVRSTIEFLTSLYKSAFTGQPVKRGSILPGDPFYMSVNGKTELA
ncbi:MAG: Gfo/Idh/MocA family oxidoreductase [Anaerolineae bacterium]|nr:Gfo/Idh/MocA family oxidoreductase [Anaerolineae bacterium]